jgi:hypothetical protein
MGHGSNIPSNFIFQKKRENMIYLNFFLGFKGQQFYEEPSKIPSTFIFQKYYKCY